MIPDYTVEVNDGVREVAFNVLGLVDESEMYDWDVEALLQRQSDGALFLASDGGCSCNYFGDNLSTADLKPVHSIDQALRECGNRSEMERSIRTREVVFLDRATS